MGKPLVAASGPARVTVVIARAASGYGAQVEITQDQATRTRVLEAPDCAALSEAVAVVVALAIDPRAAGADVDPIGRTDPVPGPPQRSTAGPLAERGPDPGEGAEPVDDPRPGVRGQPDPSTADATSTVEDRASAVGPEAHPVPSQGANTGYSRAPEPAAIARDSDHQAQTSPSRSTQADLWLRGSAGLLLGPLPAPAFSAAVTGALVLGPWQVAVGASFTPAVGTARDPASDAFGRIALWSATVEGGIRPRVLGVWMPVSLGLVAGAFHARADGIEQTRVGRPLFVAASAAVGAEFPLASWIALFARVELLVPLRRPRIGLQAPDLARTTLHRPAAVGSRLAAGLALQLW